MPSPITNGSPVAQSYPDEVQIGPPPPPSPIVTIDPVHISGDAATRQLVQRHDAATSAPCRVETARAIEGTIPMAIDVAATLAAVAAGPVAIGLGIAKLFHDSIKEGEALRELYECEKE